jgi:hypothetical protein
MAGSYVCAGFETLAGIIDRFFKDPEYNNQFNRDDIDNFFEKTSNKFLHSFGQNFPGRKKYDNYNQKEAEIFKTCRSYNIFNKSLFYVDSGAFQVSIGLLNRREMEKLQDIYYHFLVDYNDVYDRAFILDLPPGPNCTVFKDFDDVLNLNKTSYTTAMNLPEEVRNKIIYIHHFRTPKLWDIYTKILNEDDIFNSFQYHATGGIVANMSSDAAIPCIIYVLPLIPLINQAKKFNRKYLHFHILGGATFRDVLFYELFKIHVLKVHGIELNITFDSSGMFKGLMVGRMLHILDNEHVRKINLRTDHLNLRFNGDKKIIDIYREKINNMASKHKFKSIPMNEIYNPESGTFYNEVRIYTMLYMLDLYFGIENFIREKAIEIYKMYESEEYELLNEQIRSLTQHLNGGKITRKQTSKSSSVLRSLHMLDNLDEDYCKCIVDKFLSKDEFTELMSDAHKTLTI